MMLAAVPLVEAAAVSAGNLVIYRVGTGAAGLTTAATAVFLDEIVGRVLAENADAVAKIKAGNDKAINALKGQVMKLSQGKANPAVVGELLAAAIAKS